MDVPSNQGKLLVGKLADIHACGGVGLVESTDEIMWQIIELAELPLCEGSVSSPAHV